MTDLPYPPPLQGIATLAAHLDVSENTIDNWVKIGKIPAPKTIGGKRLWVWEEVYRAITGPKETINMLERITNATREAARSKDHGRGVRKRDQGVSRVSEIRQSGSQHAEKPPLPPEAGGGT